MRRLVLVALAALGCHSSNEIAATCDELKGACTDGWNATLRTTTSGAYTVAVKLADGTTSTVTCVLPGTACTSSDAGTHATIDAAGIELVAVRASATFSITVSRDGATVLTKTFTPTYAPYYPNGRDCPPMCAGASDAVDVP